jgi:hypothetical protein
MEYKRRILFLPLLLSSNLTRAKAEGLAHLLKTLKTLQQLVLLGKGEQEGF